MAIQAMVSMTPLLPSRGSVRPPGSDTSRDLEIRARRANLTGVRRLGRSWRSWRWAVVVAGVAVLAAVPAVVGALPVRATAVEPSQLAAAIVGSTAAPYQGYVETRGQLGIPDLPDIDTATALLGGPAKKIG